jgi:hypothetical protein
MTSDGHDRLAAFVERMNRIAAERRRSDELVRRARVLCEIAALTMAECRTLCSLPPTRAGTPVDR